MGCAGFSVPFVENENRPGQVSNMFFFFFDNA